MTETHTLTPYDRVQLARKSDRPKARDFIESLFDDFTELHGDRLYRDDPSLMGGIASFRGIPVTVIGQVKGKNTEENIACNFGMTSPEGYRKAVRLMKQAEKFGRPILCFVDTPGAYPGIEAESNGQSNAIAESIAFMSQVKVPTITIISGEGSSGGALALAVADRVYMLENAVYSILSPEGFASILWKDAKKASEAAKIMKLTAPELYKAGLIDGVLPEGAGCIRAIYQMLSEQLEQLGKMNEKTLLKARYQKYRKR